MPAKGEHEEHEEQEGGAKYRALSRVDDVVPGAPNGSIINFGSKEDLIELIKAGQVTSPPKLKKKEEEFWAEYGDLAP